MQLPMEEVLSQLAHKDSRIIELDSEIQKLHQTVIDLRENVSEKDEVIRAHDQAIQVMQGGTESNTGQEAQTRDETETDAGGLLLLQRQLQETNELLAAREQSVKLLTDELDSRNNNIAELSSHCLLYTSPSPRD